jgi:hypothetical protein
VICNPYVLVAEKAATAARVSAGKLAVKSEPDCEVLPCAPSFGKKRKVSVDRAVDGESSASEPSGPPGFPAPCKPPSATGKDGDWKAARRLLQGTVTPSRERELAASKPADVVASSYVSLLQVSTRRCKVRLAPVLWGLFLHASLFWIDRYGNDAQAANEVSFSLGHALELEEKLRAREREADALRAELREADALRVELREANAELAARGSSREHARALAERERQGYERGMEDMKRAVLRRYPDLDLARLIVPLHASP